MSGGSMDYLYSKVEEVADSLMHSKEPHRRAFARHLKDVSNALYSIEWVDSGDCGTGSDIEPISKVLGKNAQSLALQEMRLELEEVVGRALALASTIPV